jgi:hypothetical protein
VALRPAQVHPDEHLRPVRGLRAADAGDDVQDGALRVVLAGEQEGGPLPLERLAEGVRLAIELRSELGVIAFGEQVEDRGEVVRARLEVAPRGELRAVAVRLAEDLLRGALVVPEPGFLGPRFERGEGVFLGG